MEARWSFPNQLSCAVHNNLVECKIVCSVWCCQSAGQCEQQTSWVDLSNWLQHQAQILFKALQEPNRRNRKKIFFVLVSYSGFSWIVQMQISVFACFRTVCAHFCRHLNIERADTPVAGAVVRWGAPVPIYHVTAPTNCTLTPLILQPGQYKNTTFTRLGATENAKFISTSKLIHYTSNSIKESKNVVYSVSTMFCVKI